MAEHPAVNRRVVGSSPTAGVENSLQIGQNVRRAPREAPFFVPNFVPQLETCRENRAQEKDELARQKRLRTREEYRQSHPEATEEEIEAALGRPTVVAHPEAFGILIEVVLPAATGSIVTAAVKAAVDWIRARRRPARGTEYAVLIYGPTGKPLRKVRLRDDSSEPEVFTDKWPLPPEHD